MATLAVLFGGAGCADPWMTNTPRNAVEQYLLTTAVERILNNVDFSACKGKKVLMDYTYFMPQADKLYTQGYIERCISQYQGIIVQKVEEADMIVQPLCAVLATDHKRILIGTPMLPIPLPNTDLNFAIPELPVFRKVTRNGFAKFAFVIYSKDRVLVETIDNVNSKSTYSDWTILFVPFKTHDLEIDQRIPSTTQYFSDFE